MLCVNSYPPDYVRASRARIARQLAAYDELPPPAPAFDREFFANLVLALEASFVHRTRGLEKKDGNPLNELRMLAASLLENDGRLRADSTIRYNPARSVLGLELGQEIVLDRTGFERLADAVFADIDLKFGVAA